MRKLKELMRDYRIRTFGKYIVRKEIAHRFVGEDLEEKFFWIYTIEKVEY